jgi:hypothetical protein
MDEHNSYIMETLDTLGRKYINNFGPLEKNEYKGGDKTTLCKGFTLRYDELFSPKRLDKINFLELGVFTGRSIAMWSDYFPNGTIYGVDINLEIYKKFELELKNLGAFSHKNIKLIEIDNKSNKFIAMVEKFPMFDFIVDDADHKSKSQFDNFVLLFPKLKSGGIYVIEDIITPGEIFNLFGEIIQGVSNQNYPTISKSVYGKIIRDISYIEIRSNNLFFFKK